MKAIRVRQFGGPEVLKVETVDDPKPGPGQVVVRVKAVGVNPVETYVRSGKYASLPKLPYTPGADGAGEVLAVGAGVKLREGDRVFISGSLTGTYAEQVLCEVGQVHPLPAELGFAQGAAIGIPYATAWRALFQRAKARPGETVLVHGASGGVGVATVQLSRAAGLLVVGTAGSDDGRRLVARQGAHHVVDHADPNHLEEAVRLAGGKGFDVIVEMLANVNLGRDLPALARGGRVVVVGSRGTVELDPRDLMSREAQVLGMILYNAAPAEMKSLWAGIDAGLETGTIRPVIFKELPLEKAPQAHQDILEHTVAGKIVLVP